MALNTFLHRLSVAGFICEGLALTGAALAEPVAAQEVSSCAGIFYREPFTSRVAAQYFYNFSSSRGG